MDLTTLQTPPWRRRLRRLANEAERAGSGGGDLQERGAREPRSGKEATDVVDKREREAK